MKLSLIPRLLAPLLLVCLPACERQHEQHHETHHKLVVTCPMSRDVSLTQPYVCQIHSSRHIDICALESGYLEAIPVKEGQTVKQGDTMFKILPTLYQAKLDAELAEVQLAQIEFNNTQKLFQQNVVSQPQVALAQAKLAKAQAKMQVTQAELNFATIKAPFDGIIDHQHHQQGSLIAEGDKLTTLSDNGVMWVYFNVPERDYLKFMASTKKERDDLKVELILADGSKFPQIGKIAAIEADFNNETGNIAFRADFPNPDRLLRHGGTGTIHLTRIVKDAVVIPQRATYEILAKRYVYVLEELTEEQSGINGGEPEHEHEHTHDHELSHDHAHEHAAGENWKHGIVHQREIVVLNELDDIYLLKEGVKLNEKIVLEGIRQVRDGETVEYEFLPPEKALENLKFHAE